MSTVVFFGTFDPLHAGHRYAFARAKALGDRLIVVVARDAVIAAKKQRASHRDEHERLAQVSGDISVDEAILGDTDPDSYELLRTTAFDILALGYDQEPSNEEAALLLTKHHPSHVQIVRLLPYAPTQYKSSLLRS